LKRRISAIQAAASGCSKIDVDGADADVAQCP
jgi:hypothetical protein